MAGAVELLRRGLRPGGMMPVDHPYGRHDPPDRETVEARYARDKGDFLLLPQLIGQFGGLGYDLVEMVLAAPVRAFSWASNSSSPCSAIQRASAVMGPSTRLRPRPVSR